MSFASDVSLDPYVITGVIAILSAAVGALIWVIKFLFQKILPIIEKNVVSIDENTKATKTADQYIRDRNGRDAEIHDEQIKAVKQIIPAMKKIADNSVDAVTVAIQNVPAQHVEHQHVETVKIVEDGPI